MRKKKEFVISLVVGALILSGLTGCQSTTSTQSQVSSTQNSSLESSQNSSDSSNNSSESGEIVVSAAQIDTEFTARDMEVGYEESTAVLITLNQDSVSINGTGATFTDGILTINKEGTYVLNGQLDNGQIVVDAADTDKVQIVFNSASIHCEGKAPIYIKNADKVFLTLQEGTENTLTDSESEYQTDGDTNPDGVIFSKADVTINGTGTLNITANYKHGIVSKDDLVITGGTFHITANGQGLSGKDCVKIKDGSFELNTKGDGIQSDNTEEETKGFVYIAGGSFTIQAETDAIQAETVLRVDNGTITATTGGGSANASTDHEGNSRPEWGNWGRGESETATTEESTAASAKGLKSGKELIVNGGTITVDSSDDSLHCNGDMTIAGGNLALQSGDDGVHTDDVLLIQNGTVTVSKSYEGLEGNSVTITGGAVDITASDDGINSAGGSDTAMEGRPGQNSFSGDDSVFIRISSGTVKINASGDGIDSNGNFYVDGGEVYVEGPTNSGNGALDYAGSAEVTGGIVVATGSTGMEMGFSDTSSQYSILHSFSSSISAGTTVLLKDADGNEILSYTPQKEYQSVTISSSEIKDGTYQLVAGDVTEEITVSSVVTSNKENTGMPGGGMGGKGGRKEGDGKMQPPDGETPPDGELPPDREFPSNEENSLPQENDPSSEESQTENEDQV